MTQNTKKTVVICAVVVLVLAVLTAVLLTLWSAGIIGGEVESEGEKTVETTREPEQTVLDENGKLKSIIYYDGNDYNGRKDFYSKNGTDYEMTFDKDGKETESRRVEHNTAGSVTTDRKKINGEVVELKEYDYYEDMVTLKKLTTRTYDDKGVESAEKIYYYASGEVSRKSVFRDSKLIEESYFDEAGNVIDAPVSEN